MRPSRPNGGSVSSYNIGILYKRLSDDEQNNTTSVNWKLVWLCIHCLHDSICLQNTSVDPEEQCKNGSRYNRKWRHLCIITSDNATNFRNFTLPWVCQQNNQTYTVEILVNSNATTCNKRTQGKSRTASINVTFNCSRDEGNPDDVLIKTVPPMVFTCFLIAVVATWCVHRLKRHKRLLKYLLNSCAIFALVY